MSSDFDRAVEFAGCRGPLPARWCSDDGQSIAKDVCGKHPPRTPDGDLWPCPETLRTLRLIQEVRADECERLRPLLDEECPHEPDEHAEGTCEVCDAAFAVDAALQGRAEKHREAT